MNLDLDQWLRFVQIVVLLGSVAINVVLFVKTRSDQRFKEIDERLTGIASQKRQMQDQINRVETRSAVHEARLGSMPTHADLQEIRRELTSVKTTVSSIDERSETTQEMVRSIQTYLLENK